MIAVGGFGVGLVALVVSWICSGSFLTALGTDFCYGILGAVGLFIFVIVVGILRSIVVFFAEIATGVRADWPQLDSLSPSMYAKAV